MLEVHDQGPRHRVAALGDTMIQVWSGPIPMEAIVATGESHRRIRASGFDKVCVFAVTEGGIELPSAEVRRASGELMRDNRPELGCNAVVVPAAGFWASAARSALTGIFLIGSGGVPTKVFSEIAPACAWHAAHAVATDPAALEAAVEELRAELAAGAPG